MLLMSPNIGTERITTAPSKPDPALAINLDYRMESYF